MSLALNLFVLRCKDLEHSRRFYEQLGIVFTQEQHGKGPMHYATEMAGLVLVLYPATEKQPPDKTRLGFTTAQLVELAGDLSRNPEVSILNASCATGRSFSHLATGPRWPHGRD